ncbi:MAG TPA: RNA-guided endonuclease TnpB family protein [Thermoleophilaceae bacterium]|nr:RNA-guided endonuclease TnpB family protein [Thermoleophilaceae bacterium]
MSGATAVRAHRFRLEPSRSQAIALQRALGARRYVYNWGLQRWGAYYAAEGTSPPRGLLSAEITRLKRNGELAWLQDLPSQLPQQALFDLERSFKAFFKKRAGYPRFRRKKELKASFRIPQHVKVAGNRVYVPKIGWIRARVSRAPGADLGSATVSRTADGRWFVSINERFELPTLAAGAPGSVAGVDLGLIDIVVCDDGHRVAAPRFARQSARQVRTAQRRYARTQPGSRRREHARYRLARVHARVTNRRQDFIHKLTTEIVRRHDVVVIEDLSLTALARTKLGKSFGDAALGEVSRQLDYKTSWGGKRTITVDRFFPSTRRCSRCHALAASLALSDRSWQCAVCGSTHDRDVNAALNLRDEGLRLLRDRGAHGHEQARRVQVRPPMVAQGAEAGTAN